MSDASEEHASVSSSFFITNAQLIEGEVQVLARLLRLCRRKFPTELQSSVRPGSFAAILGDTQQLLRMTQKVTAGIYCGDNSTETARARFTEAYVMPCLLSFADDLVGLHRTLGDLLRDSQLEKTSNPWKKARTNPELHSHGLPWTSRECLTLSSQIASILSLTDGIMRQVAADRNGTIILSLFTSKTHTFMSTTLVEFID